jgi:hypothetical protein
LKVEIRNFLDRLQRLNNRSYNDGIDLKFSLYDDTGVVISRINRKKKKVSLIKRKPIYVDDVSCRCFFPGIFQLMNVLFFLKNDFCLIKI